VERLSPRQRQVLDLVSKGLTNDDIARVLNISEGTVRTHVTAILATLEVDNRTEAATAFAAWGGRPAAISAVLERPALAVLPLASSLDDPRARVIAAGITTGLSSLFSQWCWFPVIAAPLTETSWSAGRPPQESGKQLGARYVVDGLVGPGAKGWRVTVRLVDCSDGRCLWTDHQDFDGTELFEAQDVMCQAMVASAYPVMVQHVQSQLRRGVPAKDLAAWELAHAGVLLHAARERVSNAQAEETFRHALTREPTLVHAHYGLGLTAYDQVLNQWGDVQRARHVLSESVERCLSLAPHAAEGHHLLGRHFQTRGDHPSAVRALEEAVGRNPSFGAAHALLAQALHLSGRSDEGMVRMKHALRLAPRSFVAGLATLHFARREYAEAQSAAERAIALAPRYPYARALAAAAAWWGGAEDSALEQARHLQAHHPHFDPTGVSTFGADLDAVSQLIRALQAMAPKR